jgi:hypothetical protein
MTSDNDLIRRGDALKCVDMWESLWDRTTDAIAALPADHRVAKLVDALAGLVACQGDDPCRYDHHGYCQEHYIEAECSVAKARAVIAAWEAGE